MINKIIPMSNIRDLQKLRGHKNINVLAQTHYKNINPEKQQHHFEYFKEPSVVLTSRSPKKYQQEGEEVKSPTKISFHRRGGSFGTPSPLLKNSDIQSPHISMLFLELN